MNDLETLTWMSAALEGRGHQVTSFQSGKKALAALDAFTPDLLGDAAGDYVSPIDLFLDMG